MASPSTGAAEGGGAPRISQVDILRTVEGLVMDIPPYPDNRRPILPTDAVSYQPSPYPANRRPILPTETPSPDRGCSERVLS